MKKNLCLLLLSSCLQLAAKEVATAEKSTAKVTSTTHKSAAKNKKKHHQHSPVTPAPAPVVTPLVVPVPAPVVIPTLQPAPVTATLNPQIEAGLTKMSQTLGISVEELKASTIVDVIQLIEKQQSSIAQKIDKDRDTIIQTLDKETSTPEFIHTAGSKRVARSVSHAAAPRNTYDRTGSGTNPVQAFFLFGAMILDVCGF